MKINQMITLPRRSAAPAQIQKQLLGDSLVRWRMAVTLLLVISGLGIRGVRAADQFFAGDGSALTASKWAATSAGPFTSAFTAGSVVNFAVASGTGNGGSITIGGITATESFSLVTPSGTIANQGNAVVTINVSPGKTVNFGGSQGFTTSATAGYTKSGGGVLAFAGGTYGGGFTLNAGTVIVSGVNSLGSSAANVLIINGGVLAANATRDLSGKFGGGITIGGDFQMGDSVGLALTTAGLTLNNTVALGAASRTINIGANGVYVLGGIISGSSGTGLTINKVSGATGNVTLTGANTYTGDTTISGGILKLSLGGSIAASPNIVIGSGANLDVTALTTALTLASSQSLQSSAAASTATLTVSATKGVTTAANSPLKFTAYNGSTVPLTLSGAGTLALQTGNPVTVTVANGGTPLAANTDYKLVAKGTGTVTGTPTTTVVNGDGLASGANAVVGLISAELFLRTSPSAPSASAAAPVNSTDFTANWSAATGATGYRLDVATDGGFTSFVSGFSNLDVGNVLTYSVTGLSVSTAYHYRVRSYNANAASSNSITIDVTTTAGGCTAPTINSTTPGNVTCNGGSDGSISVSASGGLGSIEYSKDNGSTWQGSSSFSGLAAGTYQIRVRGSTDQCTSSATPVTLTQPTAITFSTSKVNVSVCNGGNDGSITISTAAGGSGAGYTYSDDNGSTFPGSGSSYTFTVLTAGTYQIKTKDGAGCVSPATAVTVGLDSAISVLPSGSTLTAGTSGTAYTQTFTATGGHGGDTLSVMSGSLPPGLTLTSPTLSGTPTSPGNYSFTIADTDSTGCTSNRAYTLLINDPYTHPTPQALPYSQTFPSGTLPSSSTTYPAGWQGWILNDVPGTSYKTTDATNNQALIGGSSAATTTGGVHNYNSKIGFLCTGSLDESLALAIVTTGTTSVQVQYDIMTIRNPYDGTSNTRINEATLQYRVGSSGAWTSLTGIEYQNNTTTQVGSGITTPQNLVTKSVTLPSGCDNQAVVELRWASKQVSGGGSRPSFAVDSLVICGKPAAPSTTGASRCGSGSVILGATASGGNTLKWYADAALTTQVTTGTSFNTPSLSSTTNYYVTQSSAAGCVSDASTVTATINVVPTASVNSPTVCATDLPATIAASASGSGTLHYSWTVPGGASDPGDTNSFSTSTAGTYSVVVVDANSCSNAAASGVLTVNSVTANPANYVMSKGASFKLAVTNLLANASGTGGVSLAGVQSPSSNGVALTISDGKIFYGGNLTADDHFLYMVSSTTGSCTATGLVTILASTNMTGQTTGSISTTNGNPTLRFFGIPGSNYTVQVSTNLDLWSDLFTTNLPGDGDGQFQYTDTNPPQPAGFYRLRFNP